MDFVAVSCLSFLSHRISFFLTIPILNSDPKLHSYLVTSAASGSFSPILDFGLIFSKQPD